MHLKSQNVTRGPAKKIAWDHPRFPSTKDKILELLHGFVNQFLSGGYNGMIFQNISHNLLYVCASIYMYIILWVFNYKAKSSPIVNLTCDSFDAIHS